MKKQVATILQNGIKEAIEAASSHLSEETRSNILGDLAQYAKSGTGKTLFSLACYSDGLRTIVFALCADGEISEEEKVLAGDFLRSAAGFFAKIRPEYRSFADLQTSQIGGFIKHYVQDSGSFGFKNESTRWAGIYVCQRIAEYRGDRIPIDAMRSALISAAEEVIAADGVTADEEEFLALLKENLGLNDVTAGENESGNKVLVKYSFYTRSHDDVEGLFVTTEEKLAVVQGQKFSYWIDEDEIELDFDDILSVKSRDRAFIDQVEKVLGRVICGSDIIDEYIEEHKERLDRMREQFGAVADLPENYVERPGTITNSNGMKLVRIPAGTFMMGSPEDEVGRADSETLHQVTLSQDFYMGVFPVTQAEYFRVMGVNPSHFQVDAVDDENSASHPVEQVMWDEAVEFCRKLSERPEEKAAGRVYRLPTEAEWEYACRAGSQTTWCFRR